jgi:hypothetical protein
MTLGKWVEKNKMEAGKSGKKPMGLVTIANILNKYEKKR